MFEAIASNERRSWMLISLMGALLVLLGGTIGLSLDPTVGGYFGVAGAVAVWLALWATAVGAGNAILLRSANAREIQKEDAPQLWNVVEEMTIAAGLAQPPKIYIIDDPALNAFAVGRKPEVAAVAVTSGLLKRLSRDELQGVIAHEIGHIRNLDIRFMTLAAVMVGAVVLISRAFLRGMFRGGRRSSSSRGGGQAQLVLLAVALVVAILAPLAAQLLYFACSRRREYLADASAARFTRYPAGLADALEKIAGKRTARLDVNQAVAPLCIVNPLQEGALLRLFSTHPPTAERVLVLRRMAGAGFAAYEEAYRQVRGGRGACIGRKTLESDTDLAIRTPRPEPQAVEDTITRAREVGALLDRVTNFVVIPCACGARLKLPPGFKKNIIACPRCGRQHDVPRAAPAVGAAHAAPQRYRRRGHGWESFQCACGRTVQLSPTFSAPQIRCDGCGQKIEIAGGGS